MFSTIGIVIDVVLIAVIVVFALIGLKKGLLKSVLSLFSWSVCLLIAIITAKYVAGCINGIYDFAGLIGDKITKSLNDVSVFFTHPVNQFATKEELIGAMPNNINGLLKQLIKVVFTNTSVDMQSTETIGSIVGEGLGGICMIIIAAILVFVVLKIVVKLLSKLFDNIEKTKIIGGVNKILGLALGLVKAALIIVIFNVVLVGLSLVPAVNKTITPIIKENTYVEKVIYNKTDELFEKYVIKGNTIQGWIEDLWEKR